MSESQSFGQVTKQLREFASSLSSQQRLLLGGGAALVAVVLITFVVLLSKPDMTTLYANMEPADAQALGQKLTAKNIRYELSADGRSVLVPADQLQSARLEIASQGAPHSGRLGFELFDKTNWASSDFDDKVNYQRALEGELERTIQGMSGIEAARVHLAIPPDSIYSGQERQAKAGVILKVGDRRVTPAMRLAVQHLVASAVDKLDVQNVTVVDAEAGEPSDATGTEPAGEEHSAEETLALRLIHTLEPVAGDGHVRATVHAEFDPGTVEEEQESYDPEKTVALTMQRTEESNGSPQPGGASGTASNVPGGGAPAKLASSENLAQSKSENGTYAVNKIVRHSTEPAGRLKRLAVAVLVDDAYNPGSKSNPRRKRSPEELKSIEDIARASVGFDAARGDILTVQNISFQTVPSELPPPPTRLEKTRALLVDWSRYVRIGVLAMLFAVTYWVVLRPVKKQILRSLSPKEPKSELAPHSGEGTNPALPANAGRELDSGAHTQERPQMVRLKDDIAARIRHEPASAARLVQGWIRDEGRA